MITTAFIISFIIVGFRAITGKGMVLYFMRSWLDQMVVNKKEDNDLIKSFNRNLKELKDFGNPHESEIDSLERRIKTLTRDNKKRTIVLFLMKPVILCSTCMASIHTLIWYPIFQEGFDLMIIPVILMVAFLNAILFAWLELVSGLIEAVTDFNNLKDE